MGFSFENLISQATASTNQSNATLAQGAAELAALGDQQSAAMAKSAADMTAAIQAAAEVATGKAAINYAQNATLQKTQALLGLDPDSQNFEIPKQLAKATAAVQARAPVRAEYDRLASVDLLSNPIGWIVAQTQLPQVAAQNNALADAEDEAYNQIRIRTDLSTALKTTVLANTADAIQANQVAEAEANARIATATLDQRTAENMSRLGANKMQQIQLADKMGDNKRSLIGLVASIQNAEETRRMRQEAADERKSNQADKEAERELNRERLRLLLDEKKSTAAEQAEMDARLNVVSATLGLLTPMTMRRIKALTNKEEQAAWLQAAGTQRFGGDVQKSVQFLQKYANFPAMQEQGSSSVIKLAQTLDRTGAEYIPSVTRTLSTQVASSPGAKMPSAEAIRNLAYEQYEDEQIKSTQLEGTVKDLSHPAWDRTLNVYVAPFTALSKAIDTQPELAGLKENLVKKQIDALATSGVIRGGNLTSDQQKQVVMGVQALLMDRKISSGKAAADISQYFKAAAALNLKANAYNLFALPPQEKYLFTLPEGKQMDMFDPVVVENELIRGVVKESQSWGHLFHNMHSPRK